MESDLYKRYWLGKTSNDRLSSCHVDLIRLVTTAIRRSPLDFLVLEGHRSTVRQMDLYNRKKSQKTGKPGDRSMHNYTPSLAVDLAPYPYSATDIPRYLVIAGVVLATAREMDIPIRWGGNWDRDNELADNRFNDFAHFELYGGHYIHG